jgi:tetratricopeptide (TPR) repeat protein
MDDALAEAARQAETAQRAGTADAHDYMTIALARAHDGSMAEAETLIAHAQALEPGNPAVMVGLALIRRRQGRLREAVLACDAAIRAAPGYADAWRERGAILTAGGSIGEARQCRCRELARQRPYLLR